MIITIDGPAGSGKSTVAGILAKELGFIHFNSGSLYRGIAVYLREQGFNIEKLTAFSPIPNFKLKAKMIEGVQHVYVNNKDYTSSLRENHISVLVSYVALNKECRNRVDECQRAFCAKNNIVIEGRDTGSFVFPNAEYKFYLDCSIEERAKRRLKEEKAKNNSISFEEIKKQIAERDYSDKHREIAPLVVPNNAIIVDSTKLSIEEVVNLLKSHISIEKTKK